MINPTKVIRNEAPILVSFFCGKRSKTCFPFSRNQLKQAKIRPMALLVILPDALLHLKKCESTNGVGENKIT